MEHEQPPQVPSGDGPSDIRTPDAVQRYASGSNQAWASLGYLIGGIAVWGGIGWLVDLWLDSGGIATGIGIVLGAAGGIVLIVRSVAVPEEREDPGGRRR